MRINGAPYRVEIGGSNGVARENEAAAAGASRADNGSVRRRSPDRVEISSKSVELEKLKRDLDALPDLRLDRVALAKQNLQDGGYRVEPTVLAQKMMEAYATK